MAKTLLTIAGFDPSSGAGITADLQVFAAHGYFGTSVITALTAQNTVGVRRVDTVDPSILRDQLAALKDDLPPVGVKVGMLGNAEVVHVVAEFIATLDCLVILDPVIRSSSGKPLLDQPGLEALHIELLPQVDWVTPNTEELELLGGLHQLRNINVVVTGGHRDVPDDEFVLADGDRFCLHGERIQTLATHGTGCAFSSAMICGLASGLDAREAGAEAKEYVRQAMLRAESRGAGKGPLNLLWKLGC